MTSPRRIAVVGAGPAGTALALGLVRHGYDVTLVSDRTAEEIRNGSVMSSQITFESALESESALGIARLLPSSPPIEQMTYETTRLDGSTAAFATRLSTPARSLDQRVRVPLLMEEIEHRGGKVVVRSATVEDLEDLARDHDLVVVSTGRGGLTSLFERDADRSPYDAPQRVASLTYLHGMGPAPEGSTPTGRRTTGVIRPCSTALSSTSVATVSRAASAGKCSPSSCCSRARCAVGVRASSHASSGPPGTPSTTTMSQGPSAVIAGHEKHSPTPSTQW